MDQIDKTKIKAPIIDFSPEALIQLELLIENDYTLNGKYFRILINGKGCDGFTYATGFTAYKSDDFKIEIPYQSKIFTVLLDPFTAFYVQRATINYQQGHESEGFVVNNLDQNLFAGKFWRDDELKIPPLKG